MRSLDHPQTWHVFIRCRIVTATYAYATRNYICNEQTHARAKVSAEVGPLAAPGSRIDAGQLAKLLGSPELGKSPTYSDWVSTREREEDDEKL